jgi:hypothetical protein
MGEPITWMKTENRAMGCMPAGRSGALAFHGGQFHVFHLDRDNALAFKRPSMKWNAAPSPGADLAQTLPPWRVIILCTVTRPMPVPANSVRLCQGVDPQDRFSPVGSVGSGMGMGWEPCRDE